MGTTVAEPRKTRTKKAPAGSTAPAGEKIKRTVDESHKAAMAQGRTEAATVSRYLEALATHKPKRGRKVTKESLEAKLVKVEEELANEDTPVFQRLLLGQEKKDLAERIENFGETVDISDLEKAFVKIGKGFAKRKRIHRSTFRDLGVPAEVLKEAGI